jgi:hypothetical protein
MRHRKRSNAFSKTLAYSVQCRLDATWCYSNSNSKLHGGNFELELELEKAKRQMTLPRAHSA